MLRGLPHCPRHTESAYFRRGHAKIPKRIHLKSISAAHRTEIGLMVGVVSVFVKAAGEFLRNIDFESITHSDRITNCRKVKGVDSLFGCP